MSKEEMKSGKGKSTEPNKLIIELSNLGEGSIRTIKRELKVLIEDYAWKKMVGGNIQVREGK